MNGGFENGVKLRSAGPFEWQIGDAPEPQIGLSETQKHGGRYGLTIVFSTFRPEAYRGISQLLAVEPGARYRLDAWYKSNLKTEAKYQWQVIDALPIRYSPPQPKCRQTITGRLSRLRYRYRLIAMG